MIEYRVGQIVRWFGGGRWAGEFPRSWIEKTPEPGRYYTVRAVVYVDDDIPYLLLMEIRNPTPHRVAGEPCFQAACFEIVEESPGDPRPYEIRITHSSKAFYRPSLKKES